MIFTRTRISALGMVAIAAASFLYMDKLGLQTGIAEHTHSARMSLSDTNGLVVGAKVLFRGVEIGHITGIHSSADHVEVNWDYQDSYRIPNNTRFRVDNLSALGETYLAVLPNTGSGPYLADKAVIDTAKVTVPTTFKELSERLTRLLEQVDPNRIQDVFHEMDIALPNDERVLGDLNRAGELLAKALTTQADSLSKLFTTLQPLLLDSGSIPGDLAGTTPSLPSFGHGFNDLIDGIYFAMRFAPLRDAVKYGAKPVISEGLQPFLDKTAHDLNTLSVTLLPAARAAGAAMQTVDVGQLLENAMAATSSGDAVTVHVRPSGR